MSFLIIFITPILTFGHPLDITMSVLHIQENHPKTLLVEMTWNPFEANHLLAQYGLSGNTWEDFKLHEKIFFHYIKNNFIVTNNDELCQIQPIGMPEIDYAYMNSDGLVFLFNVISNETMDKVRVKNTLFIEDFKLQTNKVVFYSKDLNPNDVRETVLTKRLTETETWLVSEKTPEMLNQEKKKKIDTDNDLLPDYLEELYGCDINNPDSDGDGYEDGHELVHSWNPADPSPSPGQTPRQEYEEVEVEVLEDKKDNVHDMNNNRIKESDISNNNDIFNVMRDTHIIGDIDNTDTTSVEEIEETNTDDELANKSFDRLKETNNNRRSFMQKMLNSLYNIIEDNMNDANPLSKIILFFVIALLGFLHAFQQGHGKTVMVSYLINKNKSFLYAFLYSSIITIAHITTVTVLGILSMMVIERLSEAYNIIVSLLPLIGASLLLIISVFVIKEGINEVKENHNISRVKGKDYGFLFTGLLIGIAPCPIGLALVGFAIYFNIGYFGLIVIMVNFGIGILTALTLIALVVSLTKKFSFKKFSPIIKYTPLVSGILMLIFALIMIITSLI
jgi:ABC-type nickel/cobalt efflux system permease component RcnA